MLYHKVRLVHLFIDPPHLVLLASEPVEITGRSSSRSRCPPVGALSPLERCSRPRPSIIRSYQWNRPRRTTSITLRPPFLWLRQSGCATQWHTRTSPCPFWRTRAAISRKHGRAPTTRSPATSSQRTAAVSVSYHSFVARQSSTASVGRDEPTWSLSPYEQHQQDRHASSKWSTAPTRSRSWLCPSNPTAPLPATWPST